NLKNVFIIIVLVQASYFLYDLALDIGALLAEGVLKLIDNSFFLLTQDNIVNTGLQFIFLFLYVLILSLTVLILAFRYIILASGIVFVPIGIFFYFIDFTKGYGKLILNFLGICILIPFMD